MKPRKWDFKLFVLCGTDGFAYRFEVYSGKENNDSKRMNNEPDLGACANVVVRLSRIIPKNENYTLYFDNYYSTLNLLAFLAHEGIYCLDTVRRNRITNCKLPNEQDMKKEDRGTSYEFVGTLDNIDISSIVWKDNKLVTLISTFVGQLPESSAKRYYKNTKTSKEVKCPHVIKEYNQHMGGVDPLDANMARHKIYLKSKK